MSRLLLVLLFVVATAAIAENMYYPSEAEMEELREALDSFAETREECCLQPFVDMAAKMPPHPQGFAKYIEEKNGKPLKGYGFDLWKPEDIILVLKNIIDDNNTTDVDGKNYTITTNKYDTSTFVWTNWIMTGNVRYQCAFEVANNSTIISYEGIPTVYHIILFCYER